uniref:Uncharacterized protein n=1 Tax=Ursus americanus TaxID=9643 RepID=A0A452QWH1_URSAM
MASLYQRFTGKINTSRSFPAPPEASHLLGGQGPEEDGAGPKPLGAPAPAAAPRERGGGGAGGRPRFQYQARSDGDDEDVRASWWVGGGTGLGAERSGRGVRSASPRVGVALLRPLPSTASPERHRFAPQRRSRSPPSRSGSRSAAAAVRSWCLRQQCLWGCAAGMWDGWGMSLGVWMSVVIVRCYAS